MSYKNTGTTCSIVDYRVKGIVGNDGYNFNSEYADFFKVCMVPSIKTLFENENNDIPKAFLVRIELNAKLKVIAISFMPKGIGSEVIAKLETRLKKASFNVQEFPKGKKVPKKFYVDFLYKKE